MTRVSETVLEQLYEASIHPDRIGGWINSLFSVVTPPTPYLPHELTFAEQKEAFFYLLERLLREGRVLLTPPAMIEDQEPCYWVIADGYSSNKPMRPAERTTEGKENCFRVWDVPIEKQIAYIREVFPKSVTGPNDPDLNLFWYDGRCPWIGWIDQKTGVLWAS